MLTTRDGLRLSADRLLTAQKPQAAVVIVHGFTASSTCPHVEALAEQLHRAGVDVLTYDGLRLTGSLFYQQVDDALFQVSGFNQNGLVTNSYKNIDEVRQYGVEVIAEKVETAWVLAGGGPVRSEAEARP